MPKKEGQSQGNSLPPSSMGVPPPPYSYPITLVQYKKNKRLFDQSGENPTQKQQMCSPTQTDPT